MNEQIPHPEQHKRPRHVAVIMDGNGRWAMRRGLPRIAGHRKGVERVRELVMACGERGIEYLTLFAFSSENWRRPEPEVNILMELFLRALDSEVDKLHEQQVRFHVVGDIADFSEQITSRIRRAQTLTAENTGLTLTIAGNYGGRWDIAQACARVAQAVTAGEMRLEEITPERLGPFLSTHGLPDPDLFIRTGGDQRISNFLLWQLAYTELYFTAVPWPDFGLREFEVALESYAGRQRRFGLTGEQIEAARHA